MAATHPTRSTLDVAANDGSGASGAVPAAKPEGPLSVQRGDLGGDTRQRARCSVTGRSRNGVFVDERGGVGIRLEPAAAIVRRFRTPLGKQADRSPKAPGLGLNHSEFSRWSDIICGRVPSCNCRYRSAASRSSCSANAKRMRSALPDPEVELLAARLQSAAFIRSSCTSATISFSGLGVHSEEAMPL